jgi:hypothetical protein
MQCHAGTCRVYEGYLETGDIDLFLQSTGDMTQLHRPSLKFGLVTDNFM